MYDLILFIAVPALTVLAIILTPDRQKVKITAAVGMGIQLILAFWLLFSYLGERKAGNMAIALFRKDYSWYKSLNINFSYGVDGISVGLILLTSLVIFAGIYASWNVIRTRAAS